MKWFSLFLYFLLTINRADAQDCSEFYKSECMSPPSKFSYTLNPASGSFELSSGHQEVVFISLAEGKDYRIHLCAAPVFNQVIQFDIYNKQNDLLYTNTANEFSLQVEFSSKKLQELSFVITAPLIETMPDTSGCVGILIEEMESVKIGF